MDLHMTKLLALASLLTPALARADQTDVTAAAWAKLTAAIRAHDAAGIAALLDERLELNAMVYGDAGCEKQFAGKLAVDQASTLAFARCLAQLKLQATTRRAGSPNNAVLTLASGYE